MDDKLRIAICEDTKSEEEKLLSIINKADFPCCCTTFNCAEDLLKIYSPNKFDLLLMDIFMDGVTGVDAITEIRKIDEDIPVAFITTSTDFALESYRLSALKYIEKPYKEKAVYDILRLAKLQKENVPKLILQMNGKEVHIPLSKIIYIEGKARQTFIHLENNQTVDTYEKISDIINKLPPKEFRSFHKSYCVNFTHIQYIDDELRCFVMSDNSNVPIRRENLNIAKNAFEQYIFDRTRGLQYEK